MNPLTSEETVTMYRPCGPQEFDLVALYPVKGYHTK